MLSKNSNISAHSKGSKMVKNLLLQLVNLMRGIVLRLELLQKLLLFACLLNPHSHLLWVPLKLSLVRVLPKWKIHWTMKLVWLNMKQNKSSIIHFWTLMVGMQTLSWDKTTSIKKNLIGCLCKTGVNVLSNVVEEQKQDNWFVSKAQKENHVLVNLSKPDHVTFNHVLHWLL